MLTPLLLSFLAAPEAPRGLYVEARTAAVYAGACHYGSQYTTQGREAVLGWHFEAGELDGVSLAGVDLVLVVAGDRNLDEPGVVRRSVVWIDEAVGGEQREAALSWLRAEHADLLGTLVRVERGPVSVALDGPHDTFRLSAGPSVELAGSGMPDHACCTMPYNVWYRPFERLDRRIVGEVTRFSCADADLGRSWSRTFENDAFFGRFGPVPPAARG